MHTSTYYHAILQLAASHRRFCYQLRFRGRFWKFCERLLHQKLLCFNCFFSSNFMVRCVFISDFPANMSTITINFWSVFQAFYNIFRKCPSWECNFYLTSVFSFARLLKAYFTSIPYCTTKIEEKQLTNIHTYERWEM